MAQLNVVEQKGEDAAGSSYAIHVSFIVMDRSRGKNKKTEGQKKTRSQKEKPKGEG